MRKPRKTYKGHTFSIRVPEKVRYGLELLSRKNQVQMSTLVLRAIETMFESEGLNRREPGQLLSLLDKLWRETETERILTLVELAPELATEDEKKAAIVIKAIQAVQPCSLDGTISGPFLLLELGRRGVLHDVWKLKVPNDFADGVLNPKNKSPFKNTVEMIEWLNNWVVHLSKNPTMEEIDELLDREISGLYV